LPFAHIPATDVLVDEDIELVHQGSIGAERPPVIGVTIGARSVGCPFHQKGVGKGFVFWGIDDCVKADTVPHGDIDFLFVVIVFDKIAFIVVTLLGGRDYGQQQEGKDKVEKYSHDGVILAQAR
jgi:hypothetical protein